MAAIRKDEMDRFLRTGELVIFGVGRDTIESLRNQRDVLAEALGKLLQAYGIIRADAALTGPELLLAAEEAIRAARPPFAITPDLETIMEPEPEIEQLLALLKRSEHLMASRHLLHEDGITDATIAAAEESGAVITSGTGAFDSVILIEEIAG